MLTLDDIIDSFARVCPKKIVVSDDLPALSALKKGKGSSMWKSIESQNLLNSDV